MFEPFIQVLKFFILFTLVNWCEAACNQNGWFGSSSCLYQCHCAGNVLCDRATGSCPQGCDPRWFGPACQYESTAFTLTSPLNIDLPWLTDGLDITCNEGSVQSLTVVLNTPHPLTWIRLVVSEAGHHDQLYLTYQDTGTSGLTPCAQERRAIVDKKTLDITCPTQKAVVLLNLHGEGVKALCSLYISGGRNMALKQATQQSHTFDGWLAKNAVDGNPGNPGSEPSVFEATCTHTPSSESDGWWIVTFSYTVNIRRFVIYNRRRDNPTFIDIGCCESRLKGFTLEAFQEDNSNAVYSYTDAAPTAKQIYTIVPQTAIEEDVKTVRIEKASDSPILTLCEVLVFGERSCSPGKFGVECDKQCNCADDQEACFVSTGGCPSGCAPGYTGENCLTDCPTETYGSDCAGNCSVNCLNSKICNPVDGHCDNGCKPGYVPPLCDDECPKTTFGQDCQQNCSSSCEDSDCDHVNGTCKQCYPGFVGDVCDQKCPLKTFGYDCKQNCSALCVDQLCDHVTGYCDNCTEDRQGPFCENECPTKKFGQDCQQDCSPSCVESDCHHVTGRCKQCRAGYFGDHCEQICPRGMYGPNCNQNCSPLCLGENNPCHHVDGTCYLGCVQENESPMCHKVLTSKASQNGEGSSHKTWAISSTVVAVVITCAAAAVVGFLIWRNRTLSKGRHSREGHYAQPAPTDSNKNNNVSFQQGPPENESSGRQYNEEVGTSAQYTYITNLDQTTSPEDPYVTVQSTDYETPQSLMSALETQTALGGQTEQNPPYCNQDVVISTLSEK